MKILTLTLVLGLPLMAMGQQAEPQQAQGQTNESKTTAPIKGKKMKAPDQPGKTDAKSEKSSDVRGQTNVKGRPQEIKKNAPAERSTTSETNVRGTNETNVKGTNDTNVRNTNQTTTTVNKQEFRSRHSEVFSLGRHPKDFFVQRFGASHVRLIGNSYFVFVDNCWVAVDVDGFVYTERVICQGDPDYVVVE